MSFFNKKEDVIDIQLTQYGKHLLSKGELKPAYYAFFDDDILYDVRYAPKDPADAPTTETQNEVQDRINETPYLKTQHVYSDRDKSVRQLNTLLINNDDTDDPTEAEKTQATVEKHFSLTSAIGTSSLGSDKLPAWKVTFLKGDLESSVSHITGSKQNIRIPQLIADPVLYTTQVKVDYSDLTNQQINESLDGSLTMYRDKYKDNSYIVLDEDYLLIDVGELNADFDNDNFDIEVFKIEDEIVEFPRYSTLRFDGSINNLDSVDIDVGDMVLEAKSDTTDGIFTIDFWVKFDDVATSHKQKLFIGARSPAPDGNQLQLEWNPTTNSLDLWSQIGVAATRIIDLNPADISVGNLSKDTWYNITITRDSDDKIYMYLNGVTTPSYSAGVLNDPYTKADFNWRGTLRLGRSFLTRAYYPFKGYIDDFKITKGLSKEVQLSLHFLGHHGSKEVVDSSDNNLTCTVNGDAYIHVEPFEKLTPLSFLKKPEKIKDGILLDNPEEEIDRYDYDTNPTFFDTSYVGYWFDIYCDHEIEERVLCENRPAADARGGIFSQDALHCPEKKKTTSTSKIDTPPEEDC